MEALQSNMNTMYILVEDRIFCITDQGDGTSALEIVEKDDPEFYNLLPLVQNTQEGN
jgi:hypothetical protein